MTDTLAGRRVLEFFGLLAIERTDVKEQAPHQSQLEPAQAQKKSERAYKPRAAK